MAKGLSLIILVAKNIYQIRYVLMAKEARVGKGRTFWVIEAYDSYVFFNLNSYQCLLIACHALDAVLGT